MTLRTSLINKFTEHGFLITREAVELLQAQRDPQYLAQLIIDNIDKSVLVIAEGHARVAVESATFRPPRPVICKR